MDLAIKPSNLEFWRCVSIKAWERVTLPSSLQSLTFGCGFNQSLEKVSLPSSLQSFSAGFSSRRVFVSSAGCASIDWWRYLFLREKVCVHRDTVWFLHARGNLNGFSLSSQSVNTLHFCSENVEPVFNYRINYIIIYIYIFDIRTLFGCTIVTLNIKLYAIILYAHAIALECWFIRPGPSFQIRETWYTTRCRWSRALFSPVLLLILWVDPRLLFFVPLDDWKKGRT